MPDDFSVRGADQFLALSQRLKQAGQTELRKELAKGVRDAAKPLIAKTRQAARSSLPQRGGLAARYARQAQRVRTSTGQKTAGVSITLKGQPGITSGRIRHPVFGTDKFVTQRVDGEWWDDTLAASAPDVLVGIEVAMGRVARKISDG
jgi:hypothetical protein